MPEHHEDGARARRRGVLAAIAIVGTAVALLLRVASIAAPLGIDQSLWASAVRGMARGQALYVDIWEQRPPGIYWMYLAGFSIFGWTPAAVAWLDVLAAAATTGLLYAIGTTLSSRLTGAVAALLYAALTMPPWLYRHGGFLERSVSETFIVVCVTAAAWCAVTPARRSTTGFAAVGLLGGAAIVFKPNAALYLPALLAWMVLYSRGAADQGSAPLARPLLAAAVTAAIVPAIAIAWLWTLGALGEAKIAVVDFNRFYVGQGFTIGGMTLAFSKAVWLRMKTDPLWAGGGIAALAAIWNLARTRRLHPVAALAVLWGAAAALVIFVNGIRLFNSYFIQAPPPLALLAAWFFTECARTGRGFKVMAVAAAVLMAGFLFLRDDYPGRVMESVRADVSLLTGRMARNTYLERFGGYANGRGYSARANAELADYVRQHTSPDDRIFLFGINGAGVYFAADRLAAHRFLRVNFFVPAEFPDRRFRLEAVLAELTERRPRYIVFERLHSTSEMARLADSLPEQPEVAQLLRGYQLETAIEDFTLYRRHD